MKVGLLIKPWIAQQAGIHQFTRQLAHALEASGEHEYFLVGSKRVDSALPQLHIPAFSESYVDPRRWFVGAKLPALDWIIDPSHMGAFALFPGVKHCTIVHDLTPILLPKYHRFTSVLGHQLLFHRALKKSESIIAISQQTEQDLRGFVRGSALQNIHQLYPGFKAPSVETEAVELPSKRFLLSVGTAEPRKNLAGIIHAFEIAVAGKDDNTYLVFAGPDGWKEPLLERIKASSAKDRIVHLGFVKPAQLQWLYEHALGLVYTSFYEGFGFPILEAMSSGCPVITSHIGSMREIAEGHAITIDPKDVQGISEAMNELMAGEDLRADLSAKGLLRQQAFHWQNFVAGLEATL